MTARISEPVEFRLPSEDDLPELLALEKACFDSPYYRPHQFNRSQFTSFLRNPRAIFLVAVRHGLLLGYLAGTCGAGSRRGTARIDSLAVAPGMRNQGVGGLLLRRFIEEAQRRGSKRVTIEVARANTDAIRFFTNRGFSPVRRLPAYYGGRYDGLRMRRQL
ncbi:MAG TPA: N-acetyltransferase [Nitrospiraceae bacterium]|jgi:ribosomal-protein-alanine N-acetyltransferase|nr:N-acetyltransferase [Nitrospiraceae bacterium]